YAALAAVGVISYYQFQNILDWYTLRHYTAPPEIKILADELGLTEAGRKIFYLNQPEIVSDKKVFVQACGDGQQDNVLGCQTRGRIKIFNIVDTRAHGMMEAVAAHEILHGVYERLSSREKQNLEKSIDLTVASLKDSRVLEKINLYRNRTHAEMENELHSIIGTEAPELPNDLMRHYQLYFKDRGIIVKFAQAYDSELSKRKSAVKSYEDKMEPLKNEITDAQKKADEMTAEMHQEQDELQRLKEQNNPSEFNVKVLQFNQRVAEYNTLVQKMKDSVARYNELVGQRNALALESNELVDAISTKVPQQKK
ncbi:MAG: hypothetical protein ACXWQQ_17340, partial [Pseudobdellovibrio sp.]